MLRKIRHVFRADRPMKLYDASVDCSYQSSLSSGSIWQSHAFVVGANDAQRSSRAASPNGFWDSGANSTVTQPACSLPDRCSSSRTCASSSVLRESKYLHRISEYEWQLAPPSEADLLYMGHCRQATLRSCRASQPASVASLQSPTWVYMSYRKTYIFFASQLEQHPISDRTDYLRPPCAAQLQRAKTQRSQPSQFPSMSDLYGFEPGRAAIFYPSCPDMS